MLEKAREHSISRIPAETNFTGMVCQESYPIKADSIVELFDKTPAILGNALAIATQQKQEFKVEAQDPLGYKELDVYSATHLNNYIVHNVRNLDTIALKKAEMIAEDSLNMYYREALKVSLAHAYYHQNNVNKALTIMGELAYLTQQRQGEYNYIMGLWALDQGSPALAASYFTYAEVADYKKAKLYNTIALAEAHAEDALAEVKELETSADPLEQEIGAQLSFILSIPSINELKTDLQRYQYCRYRIRLRDSIQFENVINHFENMNYRAKSILEMAQRQQKAARTSVAISYLNRITGTKELTAAITDRGLKYEIQQFEMLLFAYRGNLQALRSRLEGGVQFTKVDEPKKILYEALLNQNGGDTAVVARNYQFLARHNVFFEEGVLGAAQYYRSKMPESMEAYHILAEAVQVNSTSIRLQRAYAGEAVRLGFDEYGSEALQKSKELLEKL
jgi:hypothetical protein